MNAQRSPGPARLGNKLVVIGLLVALASAAAMVFSGIGYRFDLYHFRVGFTILRWPSGLRWPARSCRWPALFSPAEGLAELWSRP